MKRLIKEIEDLLKDKYMSCYVNITIYEGFSYSVKLEFNNDFELNNKTKYNKIDNDIKEKRKVLKNFNIHYLMKNDISNLVKYYLQDLEPNTINKNVV